MSRPADEPDGDRYLLANRVAAAGDRFAAMAELFDPVSLRVVDRLGIGAGSQVWEVGAGGAALPAALARRVGPGGRVVATDIDTSWLGELDGTGNVEVRRHDVTVDDPPGGDFDLVHARLLLVHLPERDRVLATLAAALRPGGRLLVEDADPALQPLASPDEHGPAEALANRIRNGFRRLLAERGADLAFGRTLPRRLREAGLADVGAEGYFPLTGPACAALEAATITHVRDGLLAAGVVSEDELAEHLGNVARGRLDLAPAPLISAWGRRR